MTTITRKFFDQIGVPAHELTEAAARAGVALDLARDDIRVLAAWHDLKTERDEVQVLPLDFALRMADAGLTDVQAADLSADLIHRPHIDATHHGVAIGPAA